LGEPGRSNLDTLGLAAPEDPGARVASPETVLLGPSMPMPHITQSRSKPPVLSPGRWLTAPSNASSAPGASYSSGVDFTGAGIPNGTAIGRGKLEGTRARLLALVADGATKGKYEGVIRHVVGLWMIGADEV
jgi:hypothetical protein